MSTDEHLHVTGSHGERVRYTDADVADDAAWAEEVGRRHFERTRHLVPGGKSLSADGEHSPRLQVVVARETKAELERRANDSGVSLSKYMRHVLEQYLTEHPA